MRLRDPLSLYREERIADLLYANRQRMANYFEGKVPERNEDPYLERALYMNLAAEIVALLDPIDVAVALSRVHADV